MTGIFFARNLTILVPAPRQRVGKRYAIAIAAAILAVLLRWILDPVPGNVAFYVTLYVTVTFCAVVRGFAPAILSGLLGFLGIFYWFVDPPPLPIHHPPARNPRHRRLLPRLCGTHRAR